MLTIFFLYVYNLKNNKNKQTKKEQQKNNSYSAAGCSFVMDSIGSYPRFILRWVYQPVRQGIGIRLRFHINFNLI